MFVATIMRSLFINCVPLFLMLSGYLMNTKKVTKEYFLKLKDVLLVYVLSTLVIFGYKMLLLHEQHSFLEIVQNILSYQQYSWYIEMYIGLYLLIPFLNLIWNNLNGHKEKLLLIGIIIFITTVPSVTNSMDWIVFPDWWIDIYPITYYFVGAYLCEYKGNLKISLGKGMCLFVVVTILSGAFSYYKSYGRTFIWGTWNAYGGIMTFLTSVLAFIVILLVKTDKWPNWLKKVIKGISLLSLPIYLTSCVADNIIYKWLNNNVVNVTDRFFYYIPVLCMVFVISLICAILVEGGNKGINKIIGIVKPTKY